jgi:hypothetical protein
MVILYNTLRKHEKTPEGSYPKTLAKKFNPDYSP